MKVIYSPIQNQIQLSANQTISDLYGLVLIGGKSSRMGYDKSQIEYHNKAHRDYLAELLLVVGCQEVYFSTSTLQDLNFPVIIDLHKDVGPISGVLSAFHFRSDVAWFVLACDYALLNKATLEQLLFQRDLNKDATLFQQAESEYLEPFLCIYEPSAYPKIIAAFEQGNYSLNKILKSLNINVLKSEKTTTILNANTPEIQQEALDYLHEKHNTNSKNK